MANSTIRKAYDEVRALITECNRELANTHMSKVKSVDECHLATVTASLTKAKTALRIVRERADARLAADREEKA